MNTLLQRTLPGHRCLAILALLSSSGCEVVLATAPLGYPVTLDPKEWNGLWCPLGDAKGDCLCVRVVDAAGGELFVAPPGYSARTAEESPDDQAMKVIITEYGDWMFANLWDDQNKAYALARLKVEGQEDLVYLWLPDQNKFSDLITSGRLPGEIMSDSEALLGQLQEEHLDFITADEQVLFEWDEPLMMNRISRHCAVAETRPRKGRFR